MNDALLLEMTEFNFLRIRHGLVHAKVEEKILKTGRREIILGQLLSI